MRLPVFRERAAAVCGEKTGLSRKDRAFCKQLETG